MSWIPPNYKSKSASKDRDEKFFIFKKKKKGVKGAMTGLKPFKGLTKMK